MYLVSFKWSANLSLLKKTIRYACDHKLTWQNYQKPSRFRGTQCFRCQRYGHISRYCQLAPRCVKCSLNHPKGECAKTSEEKVKCVNCSLEHPANYRGCSESKKYRHEIAKVKKQYQKPAPALSNRNSFTSYASAVKSWPRNAQQNTHRPSTQSKKPAQYSNAEIGAQNQQKQKQQPNVFDFSNEIQRLFGMDLASAMKRINDFWSTYGQLKDDSSRMLAMMTFLGSFRNSSVE